jgi:hypothetical protein
MNKFVITALLVLAAASQAGAQVATQSGASSTVTLEGIGMYIYPAQGQSPEQQQADESACTEWAESQTGLTLQAGSVDTQAAAAAAEQQTADATQGAAVGGAARGALAGVAIGAIAGDAGKGAAIGAVAGGIGGRRAKKSAEAQSAQAGAAQAEQQNQAAIDSFKKAAGVCLQGRGYTVQ